MVERAAPNDEKKRNAELFGSLADSHALASAALQEQNKPKFDESTFGLLKEGTASFVNAAVIDPVMAVGQLVGMDAPKPRAQAEFGSKAWYAQTIGSGAGMVIPFLATSAATSAIAERIPMARSLARPAGMLGEEATFAARFTRPVIKSTIDGAVFGAVFTPSHDEHSPLWSQRLTSALSGGLTFGSMTAMSSGLMMGYGKLGLEVESKAFQHSFKGFGLRLGTNAAAGSFAGAVSAESNSLLNGKGLATADELKQSIASFMVTGGALDTFHFAKEVYQSRQEAKSQAPQPLADTPAGTPGEARLVGARRGAAELLDSVVSRGTTPATEIPQLLERVNDRVAQLHNPAEVETVAQAVDRLLKAPKLEIPLTDQQRAGLAKQLLYEAANPKSVDQSADFACGPAAALQMAQYTNPGKHISAIVDLVTTGKTTTADGGVIDLSQQRLNQIDQSLGTNQYGKALMPDANASRTLERAAQPGAEPIIDGTSSYANQLGMLLYGNVRSQLLAPEGERAVYVKGKPDRALVEDTGERLFHFGADGRVEPVRNADGSIRIGPGVESRDLQRMYDAITGNNSSDNNIVLLNTREPLTANQGRRVLSPRELEIALLEGTGPKVLEIDANALNKGMNANAVGEASPHQPVRHVVLVEPAIDQRGRQLKQDGEPLFNVIDNYGRQNDLVGKNGMTAKELFEATRQRNESPRIEPATKLKGVGNFAEVDPEGFYRGRKPDGAEGLQSLKDKGITLVIDLIEGDNGRTEEQATAEKLGMKYINIKTSVADFGPESIKKVFEAIESELHPTDGSPPGKVFLHCARGVDRTGTISAMWRMTHQDGWTPDLALAEMRQFGWNGHTPSTERMGDLIKNPPPDFAVRTPAEQTAAEARDIGKRDNPHLSYQRAVEAAGRVFDQPWLNEHPDLQERAYEVYNSLDTRSPEVVPQGVTNVMNRLAEVMESGSAKPEEIASLLSAVESRVNGNGGYDSFFDAVRDREFADKAPLRDLVDLKDLAADAKDSVDVLALFNQFRADLLTRGEIKGEGIGRPDAQNIDPQMDSQAMHQMLQELPPFERFAYVRRLSQEWKSRGDGVEARSNLLQAYLGSDARYDPRDALGGFKDLIADPAVLARLNGSEAGRLVTLVTRESNPTRAQDVANIINNTSAFNFTEPQRMQLLRHYDRLPADAIEVSQLASYANPELLANFQTQNPELASRLASRLIAATNLPGVEPALTREVLRNAGPFLHPDQLGAVNSHRFGRLVQELGPREMAMMSHDTFNEFIEKAAKLKWKGSSPNPIATPEKLAEILRAAEIHADPMKWEAKDLTGKSRAALIDGWNKLIENIPDQKARKAARFSALQRMTADDIAGMASADKNVIKNALAGDLIEELPTTERTLLLSKLLFASHYNKSATSVDLNRIVKLLAERPAGIRDLPIDEARILRDSLSFFAGEERLLQDLPGMSESVDHMVDLFVGEPLNKIQLRNVFDGFSQSEVDGLVHALNERAPNLSMKGLAEQFQSLATDLRNQNFLHKFNNFRDTSWKDAEKVNILTVGDASAGRALAYLFYKSTGIKANVITLRPGETAHIPTGKAVLFDPLSAADPTQRAFLENMHSQGNLYMPHRLQGFSEGVNLFDIADAGSEPNGGPRTDALRAKLAAMIGKTPQHDPAAKLPTPTQQEGLAQAMTGYSMRDIEIARAQATLWLASEKLNDWHHYEKTHPDNRPTDWSQIEGNRSTAQLRAALVERLSEHVTFPEMINLARDLHGQILERGDKGRPIAPEKLLFITDADTGGSGDLLTYMYRNANGMGGRAYDRQFVTLEKAAQLMKADPSLFAVGIDDIVYSGKQLETQSRKIMMNLNALGVNGRNRLILGTLGCHAEGISAAQSAAQRMFGGPAVQFPSVRNYTNLTHFVDAVQNGADPQSVWNAYSPALFWSEGMNGLQRNDWYDKSKGGQEKQWLKSGIVLPYMVPNNNLSSLNSLYASFLGRPKAKPEISYTNAGTTYAH